MLKIHYHNKLYYIHAMIELTEFRKDYDYCLKVILYGPPDSGKSSFLNRLVYNKFALEKANSIGIEIGSRVFEYQELHFNVDLWDAYGGPEGATKSALYLKNAVGISL